MKIFLQTFKKNSATTIRQLNRQATLVSQYMSKQSNQYIINLFVLESLNKKCTTIFSA